MNKNKMSATVLLLDSLRAWVISESSPCPQNGLVRAECLPAHFEFLWALLSKGATIFNDVHEC